MTLLENTSDCTNFMFDAQPSFPGQLAQGDYFYLHKRCSWIYGWLIREGADVSWAWYDMPWVLGCDRFMDRHYGSMPRFLRRFMPPGTYEGLVMQWRPAVQVYSRRGVRRSSVSRKQDHRPHGAEPTSE
jgi:hypothetical protein